MLIENGDDDHSGDHGDDNDFDDDDDIKVCLTKLFLD